MKPTKSERQAQILQLIKKHDIGTQEELVSLLQQEKLDVTQATVSRDIKALGIIKVSTGQNKQKYVAMERSGEVASGRLMKVFAEAVIEIDRAINQVVIKTLPGMAQAAAAALDSMHLPEVVGSIAGDDTLFIVAATEAQARELQEKLRELA